MSDLQQHQLQEWIALIIVGLVVLNLIRKIVMSIFASHLARLFLRFGKVKWAMAIQHHEKRAIN